MPNWYVNGGLASDRGMAPDTNVPTTRRVEVVSLLLNIFKDGTPTSKFNLIDGVGNFSGTSTYLTGGFHTVAASVIATQAATSAGDTDANKIFLDTDDNTIRIKKTSGGALIATPILSVSKRYTDVDVSSVHAILADGVVADVNFTGSPSSLTIALYNSSGSIIDPFSLLTANKTLSLMIHGFTIL